LGNVFSVLDFHEKGCRGLRRTKIVCTIGPATESLDQVEALIAAGMDVARLNCSHGTLEEFAQRIATIREAEISAKRSVAIMIDIQGPKIRIGEVPVGKRMVAKSERLTLTVDPRIAEDGEAIFVDYPKLPLDVRPGSIIFLDDGLLELHVESVSGSNVVCVVATGGELKSRKGLTLPGVAVDLPPLGERDIEHIRFAAEQGCDFIAASFVRRADHIQAVKDVIADSGSTMQVIAKVESEEGVRNIDEIIAAADGIMVARGDLGIELPPEEVPLVQKMLIRRCKAAGKPVITATQMLDSMVRNPRPTRAEVADVANAIFDGSDAIMLSGETAVGKYPIEAVSTMHRISQRTEEVLEYSDDLPRTQVSVAEAIARATCATAASVDAAAILCSTQSGATARLVSKYRPRIPIVALTPHRYVARQLALVWGVHPIVVPRSDNIDHMLDVAIDAALRWQLISPGDTVAIAAGVRTGPPGSTNMLQVLTVEEGHAV
jgi:pyruvate kinase